MTGMMRGVGLPGESGNFVALAHEDALGARHGTGGETVMGVARGNNEMSGPFNVPK